MSSRAPAQAMALVQLLHRQQHGAASSAPLPAPAAASQSPDYSALMLDDWLSQYVSERDSFHSASLFCEIKLRELTEITSSMQAMAAPAGADSGPPQPSQLRTAVAIDLLDILIGSIVRPADGAAPVGGSKAHMGSLLMRLRDQLVRAIYPAPIPPHVLLEHSAWFAATGAAQPSRKALAAAGSLTSRRQRNEEKTADSFASSSRSSRVGRRGILLPAVPSNSGDAGVVSPSPPCVIPALLALSPWFSSLPSLVARNHALASHARLVVVPSKNMFLRLRQLQHRVVSRLVEQGRIGLLRWKFWEWRNVVAEGKEARKLGRASVVARRITDGQALLTQRSTFLSWRSQAVAARYKSAREARREGDESLRLLTAESTALGADTLDLREASIHLERSNVSLARELKALKYQLDHAQVEVHDSASHAAQCEALLESLQPLVTEALSSVRRGVEAFESRSSGFRSVAPIVGMVVDPAAQGALDGLLLPSRHGVSEVSSLRGGGARRRRELCAEIVARWVALQLRMCGQNSGGAAAGQKSDYLIRLDNASRLGAALSRIRMLSANPPPPTAPVPSFPVPAKKPSTAAKQPPSPILSPTMPGRLRRAAPPTVVVLPSAHSAAPQADKPLATSDANDDVASDDGSVTGSSSVSFSAGSSGPAAAAAVGASSPFKRRRDRLSMKFNSKAARQAMAMLDEVASPATPEKRRVPSDGVHALPSGTVSTPAKVFASLRDTDRAESVFAAAASMIAADALVAGSLTLPAEKRWTPSEVEQLAAMRREIETLKITASSDPATVDAAVGAVQAGVSAAHAAFLRARAGHVRMQAVQDEVFSQSVRLLHQQTLRRHRGQGGSSSTDRDASGAAVADALDVDLSLFTDVLDPASVSKVELLESNRVLEENGRELWKIFGFYCAANGSAAAASQFEPRMAAPEFWRFVRDVKLKLPESTLIDDVFARVSDQLSGGDEPLEGAPVIAPNPTAAVLLAQMTEGMSLIESEQLAERQRQSIAGDIGFKQFGETLLRLAMIKFPSERYLARKLKNLLVMHVLPNSSQKALAFHKQQQAAAQTVASATAVSASSAPTSTVNLNTPEVDAVFRKHSALLRQVFQIYARITPTVQTMTFNDFLGFTREFELLHKYVSQHDLKQLFANVIRDGEDPTTNANSNGVSSGGPSVSASLAAALEKAQRGHSRRATISLASLQLGGSGEDSAAPASADDDRDAPSKDLSYRQFLDLLTAVSFYVVRGPYYAVHDRVEKFISSVLASRKKLPQKVYRSAV